MMRRWLWLLQPVLIVIAVVTALGGPRRDWRHPLSLSEGVPFTLAHAKGTLETGWWWHNPALAAPSAYDGVLLLDPANVSQGIVRTVGMAVHGVAACVNASWLLLLVLAGAASAWAMTSVGVSEVGAWASGVLFALTPFALYHHVSELSLTPFLVPFGAVTALALASGKAAQASRRTWLAWLCGDLLLAVDDPTYAMLGAALIAVGGVAGAMRARRTVLAAVGGAIAVAMLAVVWLNGAPARAAWAREGRPPATQHRVVDAERYALKIRQLVTPVPGHWFPPFRAWAALDTRAGFPSETANVGSRLGLIASLGFVGLLAVWLVPTLASSWKEDEVVWAAARLTAVAVLIATVGGLGSVWSELVSPSLWFYTSVTPFVAWLALVAVALRFDAWPTTVAWRRATAWAVILLLGVSDQLVALRPLVAASTGTASAMSELQALVDQLEPRLPAGAMVLQLPIRPYPDDPGIAQLRPFDLFRPYLVSRSLRWSYPALSRAQVQQHDALEALPASAVPAWAARQGFAAILVDRRGYDDNGDAIVATLTGALNAGPALARTDRYLALDLRLVRVALESHP